MILASVLSLAGITYAQYYPNDNYGNNQYGNNSYEYYYDDYNYPDDYVSSPFSVHFKSRIFS